MNVPQGACFVSCKQQVPTKCYLEEGKMKVWGRFNVFRFLALVQFGAACSVQMNIGTDELSMSVQEKIRDFQEGEHRKKLTHASATDSEKIKRHNLYSEMKFIGNLIFGFFCFYLSVCYSSCLHNGLACWCS